MKKYIILAPINQSQTCVIDDIDFETVAEAYEYAVQSGVKNFSVYRRIDIVITEK